MAKNDSLPPLGLLGTFDMLKKKPLGVQFNINSFCCNLFEVGPIFCLRLTGLIQDPAVFNGTPLSLLIRVF